MRPPAIVSTMSSQAQPHPRQVTWPIWEGGEAPPWPVPGIIEWWGRSRADQPTDDGPHRVGQGGNSARELSFSAQDIVRRSAPRGAKQVEHLLYAGELFPG